MIYINLLPVRIRRDETSGKLIVSGSWKNVLVLISIEIFIFLLCFGFGFYTIASQKVANPITFFVKKQASIVEIIFNYMKLHAVL